jgi:hypothetical protein
MYVPRFVSYGRVKAIQVIAILGTFTMVLILFRLHTTPPKHHSIYDYTEGKTSPWRDWDNDTEARRPQEVKFLSHLISAHGLTREVPWYSRRIQTSFTAKSRMSMTQVPAKFLASDFTRARIDDQQLELRSERSTRMAINKAAKDERVNATSLLFGISTTYARLTYASNSLVKDWERWLTDGNGKSNGATLVLTLHNADEHEVRRVTTSLKAQGIDAAVLPSVVDGDATARYAELLRILKDRNSELSAKGKAKKYIGLVDDDVFFPAMSSLMRKLSKFSPDKEYYIGAPSESSDWTVEMDKTQLTYGGGAVFLTSPMVTKLTSLPCMDEKQRREEPRRSSQWDLFLYECITTHSDLNLQVLPSYYNPEDEDVYGDHQISIDGYGSGIQPLTLHHYKNSHRFDAGKGHLVTSVCGEDCFFQRFLFRDGWILVNGYTLSHYPDGVDALPVRGHPAQAETEGEPKSVVGHRLVVDRPDRPSDMKVIAWRGPKRTWRLLDAKITESGEVWQAYVKRKGGSPFDDFDDRLPGDVVHSEEDHSDVDSVIVLIWEPPR